MCLSENKMSISQIFHKTNSKNKLLIIDVLQIQLVATKGTAT